jgi:hypothetical protein
MAQGHIALCLLGAALLACRTHAQNATTTGVGDYVAQGVAATTNNTTVTASTSSESANASSLGLNNISGLPRSYPFTSDSPTWTVAPTGSGSAYATACNLEQMLYALLTTSQSYYGEQSLSTTYTTTTNFSATTMTLCDGHPRVIGSLTPIASGTNFTVYTVPAIASALPSPICSISPEEYSEYLEDPWSSAYDGPNTTFTLSLDSALTAMVTGTGAGVSSTVILAEASISSAPEITVDGTAFGANDGSTYYIQVRMLS